MKRSRASANDINKAKGHISLSLSQELLYCVKEHLKIPSGGKYVTAVESSQQVLAYALHTLEMLDAQWGGRGGGSGGEVKAL